MPDLSPFTQERISLAEAAGVAGCSARTLRRYISAGLLPAYRVGPRLLRVDRSDVDALAQRIPTVGGAS